jgi:hypothetical protein
MNETYLDAEGDRDPYEYDADRRVDGVDPNAGDEATPEGTAGEDSTVASDD